MFVSVQKKLNKMGLTIIVGGLIVPRGGYTFTKKENEQEIQRNEEANKVTV